MFNNVQLDHQLSKWDQKPVRRTLVVVAVIALSVSLMVAAWITFDWQALLFGNLSSGHDFTRDAPADHTSKTFDTLAEQEFSDAYQRKRANDAVGELEQRAVYPSAGLPWPIHACPSEGNNDSECGRAVAEAICSLAKRSLGADYQQLESWTVALSHQKTAYYASSGVLAFCAGGCRIINSVVCSGWRN